MNSRWPRALLRAALREAGYDAVGAAHPEFALRYPASEPGRGPVGAIVIDSDTDPYHHRTSVADLRARHADAAVLLIAPAGRRPPPGPWTEVLHRPLAVADIVAAVQRLLPLPAQRRKPLPE